MSNERRNLSTDKIVQELLYSQWHRPSSTKRFLSNRDAHALAMIDIDAVEYCRTCYVPVALIETQRSSGPPKDALVTEAIARMAGIPAYSVSCVVKPGADWSWAGQDIERFRVRKLCEPGRWLTDDERTIVDMSPQEYVEFLIDLRLRHVCDEYLRKPA